MQLIVVPFSHQQFQFLRDVETLGNGTFQSYSSLCHGRGESSTISSVYFWNNNDGSSSVFASGALATHEKVDENQDAHSGGSIHWNSMHIVDTGVPESKKASKDPVVDHKLSTTICSYLEPKL